MIEDNRPLKEALDVYIQKHKDDQSALERIAVDLLKLANHEYHLDFTTPFIHSIIQLGYENINNKIVELAKDALLFRMSPNIAMAVVDVGQIGSIMKLIDRLQSYQQVENLLDCVSQYTFTLHVDELLHSLDRDLSFREVFQAHHSQSLEPLFKKIFSINSEELSLYIVKHLPARLLPAKIVETALSALQEAKERNRWAQMLITSVPSFVLIDTIAKYLSAEQLIEIERAQKREKRTTIREVIRRYVFGAEINSQLNITIQENEERIAQLASILYVIVEAERRKLENMDRFQLYELDGYIYKGLVLEKFRELDYEEMMRCGVEGKTIMHKVAECEPSMLLLSKMAEYCDFTDPVLRHNFVYSINISLRHIGTENPQDCVILYELLSRIEKAVGHNIRTSIEQMDHPILRRWSYNNRRFLGIENIAHMLNFMEVCCFPISFSHSLANRALTAFFNTIDTQSLSKQLDERTIKDIQNTISNSARKLLHHTETSQEFITEIQTVMDHIASKLGR